VRQNLTIVSPLDSVYQVVAKMIQDNIGAAVVIEEQRIVGIITEKDVLERVLLPEKNVHHTLVKDVMTQSPIVVEADRPIIEVLKIMRHHQIRRLIVTKKRALFGIVTQRRLLELVNHRIADLSKHLLGQ
jgi:CBS domain-containing protein